MDFIIRECTVADAEGKGYVHYTSWHETYTGLIPQAYLDKLKLENCINIARNHPENTLVALVEEKIVGFVCYLEDAREMVSVKPASEIMAIYVLKAYQNLGIGYALMKEALKHITKNQVGIFVLKGNQHAISFYQRVGFKLTGHQITVPVTGGELVELEMILNR